MTTPTTGSNNRGEERPSVVDVLTRARALIARPEHWFQNVPKSPIRHRSHGKYFALHQNCAMTAMIKAGDVYWDARQAFVEANQIYTDVGKFNDTHTHRQVSAAFDKAIEHAKSEGRT